jgi:hypothetical protein
MEFIADLNIAEIPWNSAQEWRARHVIRAIKALVPGS